MAPKQEKSEEVVLKNELSWSLLESNVPPQKDDVAEDAAASSDLWSEFREKDQLIKQRVSFVQFWPCCDCSQTFLIGKRN